MICSGRRLDEQPAGGTGQGMGRLNYQIEFIISHLEIHAQGQEPWRPAGHHQSCTIFGPIIGGDKIPPRISLKDTQ
ncbi:hypothetical protein CLM73_13375 [Achromobacter spanius]|uniref:Uncharacterized protein n=1 Tax=Achromobacter spanius TaxID=217203 RepID=A0A2S0I7P4_9BURK|nr:hypothetical protein CLM73_13375 [Achromobacter spanius]